MTAKRLLLASPLVLAACMGGGSAGRGVVIPYEDGKLVATAPGRTEDQALRDALGAAKAECKDRRQSLAVVKQRTEYKGVLGREIVKTAEQIEEIIAAGQEGAKKVLPDLSSDEDYKVSLEFRCT